MYDTRVSKSCISLQKERYNCNILQSVFHNNWVTVILQIFGVVLFSVFSVVNGFTEIKKTPKCEKTHWAITTASTDTEI